MAYSYLTLAQMRAMLASRLNDESMVYWSSAELTLYIQEAIRCWGATANYFTGTGTFTTIAGQAWYDLSADLSSLLGNTLTDREVVTIMEYHLLEPPTTSWPTWDGTDQFNMSVLEGALEKRRNQFLEDTGIYITLPTEIPTTPAANGIIQLNDRVIQIRRVAWKSPNDLDQLDATHGTFTQLPRTDTVSANALIPGWSYNSGTPEMYVPYYATPLTQLQVVPVPIDIGRVEVVSVSAGVPLDVSTGVILGLDDDFIAYIKWGALADILSNEGLRADPQRAEYCEQRYREGVELGKLTFTVVQTKINGVPIPQMSLDDFDFQIAGWQNESDIPVEIACGNSTLVALHPVPDDVYSVEMQVVKNATVPSADNEFVQIGREVLDAVLDEAQHIAMFKLGGQEFAASLSLHERFFRAAAGYNAILAANLANFDIIGSSANRETSLRPAA